MKINFVSNSLACFEKIKKDQHHKCQSSSIMVLQNSLCIDTLLKIDTVFAEQLLNRNIEFT